MSKAILILERIKECDVEDYTCPLWNEDKLMCQYRFNTKLKGRCPLKPMPSREDIHEEIYQAYGLGKEEPYERMRDAVDKVLDEILGEEYE